MAQKDLLIAIDIGTQGTKAALFDLDMQMICTAFEKSKLISPKPGVVWQEADDIYLSCIRTIRELMEKSSVSANRIAAIGIDGQMAGIMGIDRDGEASTYYDSWLDMRSSTQLDKFEGALGIETLKRSGGQVCCNHATKILWWKENFPETYERTAKFVLLHSYITGKMTGKKAQDAVFDYTCLHFNSFSDNMKKEWSKETLDVFGIDSQKMPRIVSPFDIFGYTTKDFANSSHIAMGIPVVAGAGDTAASTFGSGMFAEGLLQDCAGTASVMCCVVDNYVPDTKYKTLSMMRSPIDGLWLPLSYINGGGLCLRWFKDDFLQDTNITYEILENEASQISAGSDGVLFCPHFSGRVLPDDATLKGGFLNLDFTHTRGHFYRSIMEGIAFEYQYYLSIIRKNYPHYPFNKMITIGGGANSTLFNQIKADTLNVKVETFECGDTALIGSAMIAGIGVKIFDNYQEPITKVMKKRAEFLPAEEQTGLYAEYGNKYQQMIEYTSALYKGFH